MNARIVFEPVYLLLGKLYTLLIVTLEAHEVLRVLMVVDYELGRVLGRPEQRVVSSRPFSVGELLEAHGMFNMWNTVGPLQNFAFRTNGPRLL